MDIRGRNDITTADTGDKGKGKGFGHADMNDQGKGKAAVGAATVAFPDKGGKGKGKGKDQGKGKDLGKGKGKDAGKGKGTGKRGPLGGHKGERDASGRWIDTRPPIPAPSRQLKPGQDPFPQRHPDAELHFFYQKIVLFFIYVYTQVFFRHTRVGLSN